MIPYFYLFKIFIIYVPNNISFLLFIYKYISHIYLCIYKEIYILYEVLNKNNIIYVLLKKKLKLQ